MALRRGFKKQARELALEVRAELGTEVFAPLDPYALAELYGIDVYDLRNPVLPKESVRYFTEERPHVFSAALVPTSPGAIIIENHVHPPRRRRSTMAHEMSHVLLEHPFGVMLTGENGCRAGVREIEEEAAELSGELLIPTDAARIAAFKGWTDWTVARYFDVSVAMATWRMNVTAARRIARRAMAQRQQAVPA